MIDLSPDQIEASKGIVQDAILTPHTLPAAIFNGVGLGDVGKILPYRIGDGVRLTNFNYNLMHSKEQPTRQASWMTKWVRQAAEKTNTLRKMARRHYKSNKGEHRGKPSLRRMIREDVHKAQRIKIQSKTTNREEETIKRELYTYKDVSEEYATNGRLRGGAPKRKKIREIGGEINVSGIWKEPQDFMKIQSSCGLANLGNTCYLNAALQCLAKCERLQALLSKTGGGEDKASPITAHLRKTCWEINRKDRIKPYKPSGIHNAITKLKLCSAWKENEEQDAGELLQILIGQLEEEKSRVSGLFRGWERSLKKCKTCENTTRNDDKFTLLTLNLDKEKEEESTEPEWQGGNSKARRMDSIEDLTKRYGEKEELDRTNQVWCPKCKERQDVEKIMQLIEGPKILVMQLQRFKKDEKVNRELEALSTPVKLTQHIELHKVIKIQRNNAQGRLSNTERYELRGVIEHVGEDTSKGHYVAYVNNNDQWTKWNDVLGNNTTWEEVKTKEAYILFWEKKEEADPRKNQVPGTNTLAWKEMEIERERTKRKREVEQVGKRGSSTEERGGTKEKKQNNNSVEIKDRDQMIIEEKENTGRRQEKTKEMEKTKKVVESIADWKKGIEEAVNEILRTLQKTVETLEKDVRLLKTENSELKQRFEVIRRWTRITKEDEEGYRNYDDIVRRVEQGSPTPVRGGSTESPRQRTQDERKNTNSKKSEQDYRGRGNEELKRTCQSDQRSKDARSKKSGREHKIERGKYKVDNWRERRYSEKHGSNGMEIDGDEEEDEEEEPGGNNRNRNKYERNRSEIEKAHRKYLEDCYWSQIGLPIIRQQNINIYSFTDYIVAKGYKKVVTTCQGLYYEMERKQIDWRKMGNMRLTVGGDQCWRGEGVTIYKPTREQTNTPVVPHRFAINLEQHERNTGLRTDRYYIHVYQTKIGPERKTLRSKEMARELSKKLGSVYYPRERDLPKENERTQQPERQRPTRERERQQTKEHWRRDGYQSRTPITWEKGNLQVKQWAEKGRSGTKHDQLADKVQRLTEVLERMLVEKGGF